MQPDWLPLRAHQRVVSMITITLDMLAGAIIGLVGELMIFGPIFGLSYGLTSGVFFGLVGGLSAGLFFGLGGLLGGVFYWLFFGLSGGLVTHQIATRTIPNEGIRRSLRSALISFLVYGLFGVLFIVLPRGLSGGLFEGLSYGLTSGMFGGLMMGLLIGLLGGLKNGGHAYLKHYVLRFLLWCNDYAPWNYIRFLDYAAERVFLRKVGGGYIFTHRLLMEYFSTLQPTDQARQTKTE